jgi:hypothetical protein
MILFGIVFLGLIFLGVFWFFYGINAKRVFKVEFFFFGCLIIPQFQLNSDV